MRATEIKNNFGKRYTKPITPFRAWWMEEENINDTDQPDCQMYLW